MFNTTTTLGLERSDASIFPRHKAHDHMMIGYYIRTIPRTYACMKILHPLQRRTWMSHGAWHIFSHHDRHRDSIWMRRGHACLRAKEQSVEPSHACRQRIYAQLFRNLGESLIVYLLVCMNRSPAVVQLEYFRTLLTTFKDDDSGASVTTNQIRCALAHSFLLTRLYKSSIERTLSLDREVATVGKVKITLRNRSRELRVKDIKIRRKFFKKSEAPPLVTDLLRRPGTLSKLGLDGREGEQLKEDIVLELTAKLAKLHQEEAEYLARPERN